MDDMRRRTPPMTGNVEADAFLAQTRFMADAEAVEKEKERALKRAEEFEKYIQKNGKVQTFRGWDKTPIFTYRAALNGRILSGWIEDEATYLTQEDAEDHGWKRVRGEVRNLQMARSSALRGL